jgi:uncharacterized membrane protein
VLSNKGLKISRRFANIGAAIFLLNYRLIFRPFWIPAKLYNLIPKMSRKSAFKINVSAQGYQNF